MLSKRLFLLLILSPFIISMEVFGQFDDGYHPNPDTYETIKADYRLLRDNPDGNHELYLAFSPLFVDASTSNFSFGMEGDLGYSFKDIAGINFRGRYAYIDRIYELDADNYYFYDYIETVGTSVNPSRPQTDLEVLGNFTVYKWYSSGISSFQVAKQGNISYHAEMTAKKKRMICIRLGYQLYSSYYNPIVSDGVHAFLPFVSPNTFLLKSGTVKGGTMVNYDAIIAGISFDSKVGLDVLFDKFGRKKKISRGLVYLDFIYARNLEIEDMKITNNYLFPLFMQCELQHVNNINPYGFRLGFKDIELKAPGVLLNLEVGLRPGIVDIQSNCYAMLRLGFYIGGELKKQEIE